MRTTKQEQENVMPEAKREEMLSFQIEELGGKKMTWCIAIYQGGKRQGELCRAVSKEVIDMAFARFQECAQRVMANQFN